MSSLTITPDDLRQRRAYIRYDGDAKIKLCHMAGAPWSEKDPDATLHPLQQECLQRKEREVIVHGGSRLGKSVLGGCVSLCESMLPGAELAIIASTYNHVSKEWQYLDRGLRKLFGKHPTAFKRLVFKHSQNYHDYEVSTIWGSEARGFSTDGDDGAQLLGSQFTRAVLGEGARVSQDIFERKIQRAVDGALMVRKDGHSRETGYISIFTTPDEHFGCSASEFDRIAKLTNRQPEKLHYGAVPFAETVYIREASVLENPAYDRGVFDAARAKVSKAVFEEQWLGKMGHKSGMVYSEFKVDHHIRPPPNAEYVFNCRFAIGMDTGAHFGATLCALGKDNTGWLLGEVYNQKQNITDDCANVKQMILDVLGPYFRTTEWEWLRDRVELWVVDPASQHKVEIMDALDITIEHPSRGQGKFDVIPTIDILRNKFYLDQLFMSDELIWHSDMIKKYVWKQTKTSGSKDPVIKEPRKDYDHCMDSMRFAMVPLFEMGPLEEPPPVQSIQEMEKQHHQHAGWGKLKEQMKLMQEQGDFYGRGN